MARLIRSPSSVWDAFWRGAISCAVPIPILLGIRIAFMGPTLKEIPFILGLPAVTTGAGGLLGGLCFAIPVVLKNVAYYRIKGIRSDHQGLD